MLEEAPGDLPESGPPSVLVRAEVALVYAEAIVLCLSMRACLVLVPILGCINNSLEQIKVLSRVKLWGVVL